MKKFALLWIQQRVEWPTFMCTETLMRKMVAPFQLIYCAITQKYALLLSWNGLSRSGMKPGHSGTCFLSLGFDVKQMMTPNLTAFTLPLTHVPGHRAKTLISASRTTSQKTGEHRTCKAATHTHAHTRTPTVFTPQGRLPPTAPAPQSWAWPAVSSSVKRFQMNSSVEGLLIWVARVLFELCHAAGYANALTSQAGACVVYSFPLKKYL